MIHLITSSNALSDAQEWVMESDMIVLAGTAIDALHQLDLEKLSVLLFEEDAAALPYHATKTISMDEWIELLEDSACRTWS